MGVGAMKDAKTQQKPTRGVSGECKKARRNEQKCKNYLNRGRREKNKLRRLRRHTREQPNDNVARASFLRTDKLMTGERAKRRA